MAIVSRDRRRKVETAIASPVMSCLIPVLELDWFNPHLAFPQLAAIAITWFCVRYCEPPVSARTMSAIFALTDAYDLSGPNSNTTVHTL